jgi:hypothetical protein
MKRLVGERKALAAAVLAFYGFLYTLLALAGAPGGLGRVIAALAGVYGLAFFGLVAGYFWARWFAVGLSLFGVIEGALGLWQMGPEPLILFILITHGLAALFLWGDAMSEAFDGQTAWRQKLSMDEHAVARLGNAVTRLGVSLPMVLIWALQPRSEGLALGAAGLALLAVAGIFRLRTWAVMAMVGAAGMLIGSVAVAPSLDLHATAWVPVGAPLAVMAAGLMLAGALPFFGPIRRFLRGA